MVKRIYTKDKQDFIKFYFKEEWSDLREVVAWRDSIIVGKVDIKILIPKYEKDAKEALDKIKN